MSKYDRFLRLSLMFLKAGKIQSAIYWQKKAGEELVRR